MSSQPEIPEVTPVKVAARIRAPTSVKSDDSMCVTIVPGQAQGQVIVQGRAEAFNFDHVFGPVLFDSIC